jgi:hypothetical protein
LEHYNLEDIGKDLLLAVITTEKKLEYRRNLFISKLIKWRIKGGI